MSFVTEGIPQDNPWFKAYGQARVTRDEIERILPGAPEPVIQHALDLRAGYMLNPQMRWSSSFADALDSANTAFLRPTPEQTAVAAETLALSVVPPPAAFAALAVRDIAANDPVGLLTDAALVGIPGAFWLKRARKPGQPKPIFELPADAMAEQIAKARQRTEEDLAAAVATDKELKAQKKLPEFTEDTEAAKQLQSQIISNQRTIRKLKLQLDPGLLDRGIEGAQFRLDMAKEAGAPAEQIAKLESNLAATIKRQEEAKKALTPVSGEEFEQLRSVLESLHQASKFPKEVREELAKKLIADKKIGLWEHEGAEIALTKLEPGQPLPKGYQTAAAFLVDKLAKQIVKAAEAYSANPTIEGERQLAFLLKTGLPVIGTFEYDVAQASQITEAAKYFSRPYEAVRDVARTGIEGMSIKNFADMVVRSSEVGSPTVALKEIARPNVFRDLPLQVLTNAYLSAVGTPIWNLVSTATLAVVKWREMAQVSRMMPPGVMPGEADVWAQSLVSSYWKLLTNHSFERELWDAEKAALSQKIHGSGDPVDAKLMARNALSAQTWGATGTLGTALDAVNHFVNAPTYATMLSDSVAKFAIKDAYINMLAHRVAMQQVTSQVERGATLSEKQFRDLVAKERDAIKNDPLSQTMVDGKPVYIREIADNEAATMTMMGEIRNRTLNAMSHGISGSTVGQFLIPFFSVTARQMEMAVERAPFHLGKILPEMRADLAAGGERAAAARAKLATGHWIAAIGTSLALYNEYQLQHGQVPTVGFTGSLPLKDEFGLASAVIPDETLFIGDKQIPLAKLGVVGSALSLVANTSRLVSAAVVRGMDPSDFIARTAAILGNMAGNNLLYDDLSKVMAALGRGDFAKIEEAAARRATLLAQGGTTWKQLQDAIDGEKRQMDLKMRDLARHKVYNAWGDPVNEYTSYSWPQAFLSVTDRKVQDYDRKLAMVNTLLNNGVRVQTPDRVLEHKGMHLQLTMEEYHDMLRAWGSRDLNGLTLLEELELTVQRPAWTVAIPTPTRDAEREQSDKVFRSEVVASQLKGRRENLKKYMVTRSPFAADLLQRFEHAMVQSLESVVEQQRAQEAQRDPRGMFNFGGNQP